MVGDVEVLEADLAEDLGRHYLRRISPYEARLHRRYFRGPNRHLREGHRLAQSGQMEEARLAWRTASELERPREALEGAVGRGAAHV